MQLKNYYIGLIVLFLHQLVCLSQGVLFFNRFLFLHL